MLLRRGSNEEWVFNLLRLKSHPDTNIVEFNPLDSGNKDKFYKGCSILKQLGVIHKIRHGKFLINPNYLTPFFPHYKKVLAEWLELTNKKH